MNCINNYETRDERMTENRKIMETQGKTKKDNINQNKKDTQSTGLQSPKAGTATPSPTL
jgi:hypothetical protein